MKVMRTTELSESDCFLYPEGLRPRFVTVMQSFHIGVRGFFEGYGDGGRLLSKGPKNNGRSVLLVSEFHREGHQMSQEKET